MRSPPRVLTPIVTIKLQQQQQQQQQRQQVYFKLNIAYKACARN